MGHSRPLFLHFRLFNTVDSNCSIKTFADDWIRTEDLLNGSDRSTNRATTPAQQMCFTTKKECLLVNRPNALRSLITTQ